MATPSPRLVVGYDGSPESRRAAAVAALRAGRGGTVWVVHAYQAAPELYDLVDSDRWDVEHRDRAQALLDTLLLTGDNELLDANYETELVAGPTAPALLAAARAHDADEIIIGTRGRGPVRALLGSVAHELLAIADRPVLVIPAGALTSSGPRGARWGVTRTAGTGR
ncbi:MAG: universal stress protein [Solirubrobacteraceae bacterium]